MNLHSDHPTRLSGLDVARALAIFGMAFIHVIVMLSGMQITLSDYSAAFDWFSGRPAATFMVLAGLGVSLRVVRASTSNALDTSAISKNLTKRGVFFLIVGYLNLVIWQGDILRVYGIAYLLGAILLGARNVVLGLLAIFIPIGFLIMNFWLDFETNWNFDTLDYYNIWTSQGAILNLFFNGFRAVFPWLGLFFLGMLIGRLNLQSKKVLWQTFLIATSVIIITELLSYVMVESLLPYATPSEQEEIIALFGTLSLPAMPMFILSAGALAVAAITACLLLANTFKGKLLQPLANVGQLAFTWYIFHIIIILAFSLVIDSTAGMALGSALMFWVILCVFMVVCSYLVKNQFKYGPLEWLLRETTR